MKEKALVVIDLQNDITKNYKKIIGQVNAAIDWAVANDMHVIYIKHYNLAEKTRTFKPDTKGSELVPELKVVSGNIFEQNIDAQSPSSSGGVSVKAILQKKVKKYRP